MNTNISYSHFKKFPLLVEMICLSRNIVLPLKVKPYFL